MYETHYDKLQQHFGGENIQLHYMDTDSFHIEMRMKAENIIKDLKNLEDMFVFSNLDEKNELFSSEIKKLNGKLEKERPKNIWIDEFVCLRSNMYSLKCGDDIRKKLKGICKSQSKHNKFQELKICLNGRDYQREFNNFVLR